MSLGYTTLSLRHPLLFSLYIGLAWVLVGDAVAADGLPTVEEIKRKLEEQRAKVESMYLEVYVRGEATINPKEMARFLGKDFIADEIHHFAFKSNKRYRRTTYQKNIEYLGSQTNGAGMSTGPGLVLVYDGSELRRHEGQVPNGHRYPQGALTDQFDFKYFTSMRYFVSDPTGTEAFQQSRRNSMPPWVLDNYKNRVLSADTIEDSPCVRVEGTRELTVGGKLYQLGEKLWFDLKHDLMLRQLEISEGLPAQLSSRIITSKPKEILPGVWFPMESRIEEFAATAPEPFRGRPLLITRLSVRKCDVNNVQDDLFQLEFPAGTFVMDGVAAAQAGRDPVKGTIVYEMPADNTQLDQVIAQSIDGVQPRWGIFNSLLVGITALTCIVALVIWLRTRRPVRR